MSGIVYPCAACKFHHKKCGEKCELAAYFPPSDYENFKLVHKIFGTSYIKKILKDVPIESRGDAVKSMVYEARARDIDRLLRDRIVQLESQLAELLNAKASLSLSLPTVTLHQSDEEFWRTL
ncbi:hypothetical protein SUGI_0830560 [Cryptomeria japonica]|nr:hypothetical protein SUGI_0830560 [Cryptomeria japonica]